MNNLLKKFYAYKLILLGAGIALTFSGCSKNKEGTEKFNGYSIKVEKCVYNNVTQTGSVELKITGKELGLEKLFYTSEDVLRNGENSIADEEYNLKVSAGERSLESQAYEVDYQDDTQTVKIYYIDPEDNISGEQININIMESQSDKTVKSIQGNLKTEDKGIRYRCDDAPLDVCMSSTGIFVGSSPNVTQTMNTINLKSADKEYVLPVNEKVKFKETDHQEQVEIKKRAENDKTRIYAADIKDWKKIEQIVIGDYIYGNENMPEQVENSGKIETFYTDDLSSIAVSEKWKIEDCYITNKHTGSNYFRIDENKVLWGSGYNQYGQLGLNRPEDTNSVDVIYEKEQKIAENVVHVDSSFNGYFTVYLTEDGKLYGVGANLQGVLREKIGEDDESNPWMNIVYTPKLLMEDVCYVRAGMECVTALTTDGNVYWWGEFWEKDMRQPAWTEPHLMLENAVYTVTGDNHAGAITTDGELYMWGINQWGQSGAGEDVEFLTEPEKVADDVRMVWCDEMRFNSIQKEWNNEANNGIFLTRYNNTFVMKENDRYYGAGKDLGTTVISTGLPGDMLEEEMQDAEQEIRYSAEFLPIKVEEK